MAEETEKMTDTNGDETMVDGNERLAQPDIDSKYRMIILAAQRSKQLQRGANPRVELDPRKHKSTRIAMKELEDGQVHFETLND